MHLKLIISLNIGTVNNLNDFRIIQERKMTLFSLTDYFVWSPFYFIFPSFFFFTDEFISNRTFLDHQKDYLQPSIVRVFQQEQRRLVASIGEDVKLLVGGDGRADSPGHSTKYMSYSLMDNRRKKVLDIPTSSDRNSSYTSTLWNYSTA